MEIAELAPHDPQQPRRPAPPQHLRDRTRDWLAWFGLGHLLASALAVAVVCAGAYWLVRTPPPPSEASLPRAAGSTAPQSTMPTPATTADPSAAEPAGSGGEPGSITVHVAGAVRAPGVYRLPAGARVLDAIVAAEGASDDAHADALNLAAVVVDGSRIHVPLVGEQVEIVAGSAAVGTAAPGPIDVNRASPAELESLPGVGPATAAAIVTERERNGPFLTVDDLERVPGIGPAKLASLREFVTT
ncbi:MAG: ComEA family DNA-binding protein [Ilumatobacter sp.]|nr:ComEA family DNA-binding protein [Ilumatobacter sp.]